MVTTQVVLNYHPHPATVGTLVRDIGVDYEPKVIDPAIQESVKAATARFTAEELITQRPLVSESIKEVLGARLTPRGIIVEDLSITEFNFSPKFSKAIEAQQQVAQAEAQAEARLMVAKAEAEGLRLQRDVISPPLLHLRFIEKWDGILPRFNAGDGGLVPLINIPQDKLQGAQRQPTSASPQSPASTEEAPAAPTTTP